MGEVGFLEPPCRGVKRGLRCPQIPGEVLCVNALLLFGRGSPGLGWVCTAGTLLASSSSASVETRELGVPSWSHLMDSRRKPVSACHSQALGDHCPR